MTARRQAVGSGGIGAVCWSPPGGAQRLGQDHNDLHGGGDGGGPAVRGVRVSCDPGGTRCSRVGACGVGAVVGRAQAGLREVPRLWQMVPAVRGGRCRERLGRRRYRGREGGTDRGCLLPGSVHVRPGPYS
jgi:hypothetical protein